MNTFTVLMAFALATVAVAEPPSSYGAPSQGHGGGGGQTFRLVPAGGGGGSSFGSAGGFGGGGFGGGGAQSNEGQNIDPQLLQQVRQILLQEESKAGASGGQQFNAGGPSGSYGAPQPQYGAPAAARIVGIELEGVRQGIQVASFSQQSQEQSNAPSSSYGAPAPSGGPY